jgi:hypothetical protein
MDSFVFEAVMQHKERQQSVFIGKSKVRLLLVALVAALAEPSVSTTPTYNAL